MATINTRSPKADIKTLVRAAAFALPLWFMPITAPAAQEPALLVAQSNGVSLEQAAATVRERTGGRVLSAQTQGRGGERVHRIKVLTEDKKVRIIHVDAETGAWR